MPVHSNSERDEPSDPPVEQLLADAASGEVGALEELFSILYEDLYRGAAKAMMGQGPEHSLQPTALVSEAYVRIVGASNHSFNGRSHFLIAASKAMRHVLVDHHRAKMAGNRPFGKVQLDLDQLMGPYVESAGSLEDLGRALEELSIRDEKAAQIVELRFFGGVEMAEIARILGTTERALRRRWPGIRAWLHARLK